MAEHRYPKLHINLDIDDDGILTISRMNCSGRVFSLKEWNGQSLIDNICDCLRDYLKFPNEIVISKKGEHDGQV